ncbi:MAG: class I SAM-dependent methyltransferase [Solirubrobacteraceae bacterium]
MRRHPLALYADGLRAGSPRAAGLIVRLSDGSVGPLALERYLGPADAVDLSLLEGVRGPVLDVGCGPGRLLHALAARGVFALGVDLSSAAVVLAREGGARAIVASIFDELPGAGSWRTALLLDGNIGIGGEPVRLLERVRSLLGAGGELLVELERPGSRSGPLQARLERGAATSAWFAWARVAFDDVGAVAGAASFTVRSRWEADGRWFARLRVDADPALTRSG